MGDLQDERMRGGGVLSGCGTDQGLMTRDVDTVFAPEPHNFVGGSCLIAVSLKIT